MSHPIRTLLLTIVCFCCGFSITSACLGQLTWTARQAELNASVADPQVQASYAFANNTDHPITITNITTSCGCTTAGLEKKTYAPGESGAISATFTIGDASGEQNKTIATFARGSPQQRRRAPGRPGDGHAAKIGQRPAGGLPVFHAAYFVGSLDMNLDTAADPQTKKAPKLGGPFRA